MSVQLNRNPDATISAIMQRSEQPSHAAFLTDGLKEGEGSMDGRLRVKTPAAQHLHFFLSHV